MDNIIKINGEINGRSIHDLIGKFIDNKRQPLSHSYAIDLSGLIFIDPCGVTALANLFMYLNSKGCVCNLVAVEKYQNKACQYLDDCGFFETFIKKKLRTSAKCRATTQPLRFIPYQEYHQWLSSTVSPWLSRIMGGDVLSKWPELHTILGEIFNNIKDHTGLASPIASVFMQHYPQKEIVKVAISDFGKGIPTSVRSIRSDLKDDNEAIFKATEDAFTTMSSPQNRGSGLDTLIKNVVCYNKGSVNIVSEFGSVYFSLDFIKETLTTNNDSLKNVLYPGTLLNMEFKTELPYVVREDFSW